MKKRFLPLLLSLTLTLSALPVRAAGEDLFPAVNTYPGYADVKEGDWFYDNAKLCYEIGLMNGTDHGFAPHEILPVSQVLVIAARLRIAFTGEAEPSRGESHTPWYAPYQTYWENILRSKGEQPQYNGSYFLPELPATRAFFLSLLALAIEGHEGDFPAINTVTALPDTDDPTVLFFYNMGLLTGVDEYGTFDPDKTLTRAEAAAMISRLARPQLRQTFTPAAGKAVRATRADSLWAADMAEDTPLFQIPHGELPAYLFLAQVNSQILRWETALGDEFNWHYVWTDGKSVLDHVKDDSLSALGVTEAQGTAAYKNFDVQVYYSRLIDRLGAPLGSAPAAESRTSPSPAALREYTLTEIPLPEGWALSPEGDNDAAAGWTVIVRTEESGRVVEEAIYRASDGAILDLDGWSVYSGEGPWSRADATRCLMRNYDPQTDEVLQSIFDVEQGKFLPDEPIEPISYLSSAENRTWSQPTRDEATGLYGYRDETGNWTIPARYNGLWYLGDGMFNYWGDEPTDCGLVSLDGVETPTETFKDWLYGCLSANHGLIARYASDEEPHYDAYFDYAGNRVSEAFDWAGPIGDDGAGFVCQDGKLFRIQF